jgi:hypothetical protein
MRFEGQPVLKSSSMFSVGGLAAHTAQNGRTYWFTPAAGVVGHVRGESPVTVETGRGQSSDLRGAYVRRIGGYIYTLATWEVRRIGGDIYTQATWEVAR